MRMSLVSARIVGLNVMTQLEGHQRDELLLTYNVEAILRNVDAQVSQVLDH